ncbi:potassium channel subfamily K member 13-like isoform X2 [Heterodontus francisci]|uniref:potassium channel subfamily K member 13-like isoform X2 n=1 Tax=Heterodontus francisci TaxID=7792 RepID=UPI00355C6F98
MAGRGGCCSWLRLNEDNARFALLALFILLYLLCGAAVFSAIERPMELRAQRAWSRRLANFTRCHNISRLELGAFLKEYEEASVAGIRVDRLRPRWDFTGAFYFVGTVVSTIGFGMATPVTVGGRIFLIFYGLVGCAATILFFNLFLERIITLLAYILRWFHEQKLQRSGLMGPPDCRGSSHSGELDSLDGWKPSVYYFLNWILKKMECQCCRRCQSKKVRTHWNAVHPATVKTRRHEVSVETVCDSETDGRRMSGEMISVKDFLASNKVSLAIMQKQLSETANGGPRQSHSRYNGFCGGVGALAIMNNRLAETSVDR